MDEPTQSLADMIHDAGNPQSEVDKRRRAVERGAIYDLVYGAVEDSISKVLHFNRYAQTCILNHNISKSDLRTQHRIRNPVASMTARQNLAKERREKIDLARQLDMERKLRDRQERIKKEQVGREIELLRKEQETVKQRRELRSFEDARKEVSENMEQVRAKTRKETEETVKRRMDEVDRERLKIQEGERSRAASDLALKRRLTKVEEMFMIKTLKFVKVRLSELSSSNSKLTDAQTHFRAWRGILIKNSESLKRIIMMQNWKLLNSTISQWHTSFDNRVRHREREQLARELQRQNELGLKVQRFNHHRVISKVFLAWGVYTRLEVENKALRRQHEGRKRMAETFLERTKGKIQEDSEKETETQVQVAEQRYMKKPTLVNSDAPTIKLQDTQCLQIIPTQSPHTESEEVAAFLPLAKNSIHPPPPKEQSSARKLRPLRTQHDLDLLQKMVQREKERQDRKLHAETRRWEKDQSLALVRQQEQLLKLQEEEQERQRVILAKRIEREERELADCERVKAKERQLMCIQQAKDHYLVHLKRHCGLAVLKRIVQVTKIEKKKAVKFQESRAFRLFWKSWKEAVKAKKDARKQQANAFYSLKLKQRTLLVWRACQQAHINELQEAYNLHQKALLRHMIKRWLPHSEKLKSARIVFEAFENAKAESFASPRILKRAFEAWQEFIKQKKDDKWRQFRRDMMRERVKDLLKSSTLEETMHNVHLLDQPLPESA